MLAIDVLESLVKYAKKYSPLSSESIARNNHMNDMRGEKISQQVIDAVLTDFINYIGINCGIDYALYASDIAPQDSGTVQNSQTTNALQNAVGQ